MLIISDDRKLEIRKLDDKSNISNFDNKPLLFFMNSSKLFKGIKNGPVNFNTPKSLFPLLFGGAILYGLYKSIYYGTWVINIVEVGHYAIKFNKITGLSPLRYR